MHTVANIPGVPLVASTPCSVGQQLVRLTPAEHERAPGDPQADAERGLVGAVARDVADHGEHAPRRASTTS